MRVQWRRRGEPCEGAVGEGLTVRCSGGGEHCEGAVGRGAL